MLRMLSNLMMPWKVLSSLSTTAKIFLEVSSTAFTNTRSESPGYTTAKLRSMSLSSFIKLITFLSAWCVISSLR